MVSQTFINEGTVFHHDFQDEVRNTTCYLTEHFCYLLFKLEGALSTSPSQRCMHVHGFDEISVTNVVAIEFSYKISQKLDKSKNL